MGGRIKLLALCALCVLAVPGYGQGLHAAAQGELAQWAVGEIKSKIGSSLSLADLYYGVEAVAQLSPSALAQLPTADACQLAKAQAPGASLSDSFFAVSVLQKLGCADAKLSKDAEAAATAAVAELGTVEDGYYAIATLAALKQAGVRVKAPSLDKLGALLKDVVHSTGAVKSSVGKKLPGFATTGMAYLSIAAARTFKSGFSVPEVESNVNKVVGLAKPDGGLWGKLDADHLESTARVVQGAVALGAAVDAEKVAKVAGFLAKQQPVGSLPDAYFLAAGLRALSGSPGLPAALLVTPLETTGQSGQGKVAVEVSTTYGARAPDGCEPKGTATKGKKGEAITLAFQPLGQGKFAADFAAPELGAYSVSVDVVGCEDAPGVRGSAAFEAYVTDQVSISEVTLTTAGAGGDSSVQATYPQPVAQQLTVDPKHQLKVSFKLQAAHAGAAVTPQQAMLVLTSAERGASAYFVAKAKDGVLSVVVTSAGVEKQLGTLGGDYSLRLLVGDVSMATPIDWALGSAAVAFKPLQGGAQPPAPGPSAAELSFQPKPEILHMHRAPEKQPPVVVSMAFTVATLAPLAGVVLLLPGLRANLKGMPSGLAPLVFHGGILSILVLYWLFWTHLNLLQTLPLLMGLGLVTSISGYFALSAHADARLKKD